VTNLELFFQAPTEAMMDETEDRLSKGRARRCIPAERTDDDVVFAALRKDHARLTAALEEAKRERDQLREQFVWQTKNADNCRADASRMGQLWEQAVEDWKEAKAGRELTQSLLIGQEVRAAAAERERDKAEAALQSARAEALEEAADYIQFETDDGAPLTCIADHLRSLVSKEER
jgi:hypothetical protein